MAIGVRILSDDLSGQTANVTYLPDTGGTIDLGSQIFPFNYISDYYYGQYNCYVPLYGYTYSITVPGPTPTPTVTSTPTPTPTVTSTPTTTPTVTSTPTTTNTPTNTPTLTPTPSTTFGLTPTNTSSNTPTPTNTPSVTPTSGTYLASLQSCSNPNGPIVGQMVLPNSYQSYTTGPFSTWYSYTVIDTLGNCYNVAGIGGGYTSFTWSGIDTSMWINNFGLGQYTGCTQCITTPTPTNTSTTTPTQTPSAT